MEMSAVTCSCSLGYVYSRTGHTLRKDAEVQKTEMRLQIALLEKERDEAVRSSKMEVERHLARLKKESDDFAARTKKESDDLAANAKKERDELVREKSEFVAKLQIELERRCYI